MKTHAASDLAQKGRDAASAAGVGASGDTPSAEPSTQAASPSPQRRALSPQAEPLSSQAPQPGAAAGSPDAKTSQPGAAAGSLAASPFPRRGKGMIVVVVSGLSGAGKSTVLHVFEDLRLFMADGVPVELVSEMVRLLQSSAISYQGLALGLDQRRPGFADELPRMLASLAEDGIKPKLIYLEADAAVLTRRYATTRRPHPLEREGVGLTQAMREEQESLQPVREVADLVIDTSSYSIHELRRVIQRRWNNATATQRALRVNLISFGFKYGVPREADMVFDLRFLPNPYFVEELKALCGKDKAVSDYVFADPAAAEFRRRFFEFMDFILPQYDAEGRYRISIAIGCTGGRHRSVALTEAFAAELQSRNYPVIVEHRHMELG